MGIDYDPKLIYGILLKDTMVYYDEYLTDQGCYPDTYRHGGENHTYGMSVDVDDLAAGTLPKEVKLFGELMKEHFGVVCRARLVLTGDIVCDCCGAERVSLRTMFKELKPELSDEELLERFNDICKQVKGSKKLVTMKQFTRSDYDTDYSEGEDASGDESAGYRSSADNSSGDEN
jgi:hypothetical protein